MLKTKIFFILLVLITVIAIYFYYLFDKSYMISLEAKKLYRAGDYQSAMDLAQKAYELNQYNRMAFTVLVQSEESLKWVKYIRQTKEYLAFIRQLNEQEEISKGDLLRIKMICEISVADFEKLNQKNRLIDEFLKKDSQRLNQEIVAIRDELFK